MMVPNLERQAVSIRISCTQARTEDGASFS